MTAIKPFLFTFFGRTTAEAIIDKNHFMGPDGRFGFTVTTDTMFVTNAHINPDDIFTFIGFDIIMDDF